MQVTELFLANSALHNIMNVSVQFRARNTAAGNMAQDVDNHRLQIALHHEAYLACLRPPLAFAVIDDVRRL